MRASLRARLQLGLGGIALAVALLALAAVLALDRLGGAVATILQENYASVVACEQMKEALERQDSALLFAASGREDIARPMLDENRRAFDLAFAREAANITLPEEGALVAEIGGLYGDYRGRVDAAMALVPGERNAIYFRDLLPAFTRLKDKVQRVLRLNHEHMERADREARALAARTVTTALFVGAAAALLALWLAFFLPRAIVRPLSAFTRAARSIGEGDFSAKVDDPGVEELVPLAEAFRRMQERLRAYRESSLGELLAAKDLARATLACMLDPVVVFDRDGNVPLANEAAEAAFGLREGSVEELATAKIEIPEALGLARDRVFATSEPVLPRSLSESMTWRGAEGEKHYLVRAAPLQAAAGDKPGAIVVAQDVTRFYRIDELKSDMVATVSHQLKTPLTSLRMATHLLLEPRTGPLSEPQRELVTTARDDAERLRAMVEDLLDVVRIEAEAGALHRAPVHPAALLAEVAEAHRTIARDKGVSLTVEPDAPRDPVEVDAERLSIALANLVSNAVRHTPQGGHVRLEAAREGRMLRLTVADDGEGIAPADLPRIFDRAVSLPSGDEGHARHGLGLTIAREIALQHGGEIRVESRLGEGSTFTLILPVEGAL
ncbi:MAG: ATP-binding protein [Byssovorax sp.]